MQNVLHCKHFPVINCNTVIVIYFFLLCFQDERVHSVSHQDIALFALVIIMFFVLFWAHQTSDNAQEDTEQPDQETEENQHTLSQAEEKQNELKRHSENLQAFKARIKDVRKRK